MITHHTRESLIEFERGIKLLFANGELPFLVHLSGGNEGQLLEIFRDIKEDDWVLASHRGHYAALLKGCPPEWVESEILAGRSMFLFNRERNFLTSSILGGTAGIAAGIALSLKQSGSTARVFCFLGDGSEDNGHVAEAIRYATSMDLPCTFIIEDNGVQVDTSYAERWGTDKRMDWQSPKVRRYFYTRVFPHGGAGLPAGSVTFKPEAIARYLNP